MAGKVEQLMCQRAHNALDVANAMLEVKEVESSDKSGSDFSDYNSHYGTRDFHIDFTTEKGRGD